MHLVSFEHRGIFNPRNLWLHVTDMNINSSNTRIFVYVLFVLNNNGLTFRVPVMWRRCGSDSGFGFVGSSRGSDGRFGGRSAADVMVGHGIIGGTARCHSFFFCRRTVARVRAVRQPRKTRRPTASRRRLRSSFQRTSVVLVTFKLFLGCKYTG